VRGISHAGVRFFGYPAIETFRGLRTTDLPVSGFCVCGGLSEEGL
jgi:hypothetical protein